MRPDPWSLIHRAIRTGVRSEAPFGVNPTSNYLVVSVDTGAKTCKIKRKGDAGDTGLTVPYDTATVPSPYTTSGGTEENPATHSRVQVTHWNTGDRITAVLN